MNEETKVFKSFENQAVDIIIHKKAMQNQRRNIRRITNALVLKYHNVKASLIQNPYHMNLISLEKKF